MEELKNDYKKARKIIDEAEGILITASNGLSISEGYNIFATNEDFISYFSYFHDKYGIRSILEGFMAKLSKEEHNRFIEATRKYMIEDYKPSKTMKDLFSLVKDKDYFILTSNADKHFQESGFEENRLFEIEGNFFDLEIYSKEWEKKEALYDLFIQKSINRKLLVLELGIGRRNMLIKAPTMDMISKLNNWSYITFNMPEEINIANDIKDRSLAIKGDITNSLSEILQVNR